MEPALEQSRAAQTAERRESVGARRVSAAAEEAAGAVCLHSAAAACRERAAFCTRLSTLYSLLSTPSAVFLSLICFSHLLEYLIQLTNLFTCLPHFYFLSISISGFILLLKVVLHTLLVNGNDMHRPFAQVLHFPKWCQWILLLLFHPFELVCKNMFQIQIQRRFTYYIFTLFIDTLLM